MPRVLFIGTSLTAGLGLDPDSAYPAIIARRAAAAGLPITVSNAGVSGETSAGALRRMDWLVKEPVDVVVIETGANDGLRGVDPDSTAANLRSIIAKVQEAQPSARIALVQMEAPTNLGASYTSRFRTVFPTVATQTSVTLFPFLLDSVAGVAALNQADGIHPNEEGARRVATTIWAALQPLIPAPTR
jgi:acyl-CoA thioesterase-1